MTISILTFDTGERASHHIEERGPPLSVMIVEGCWERRPPKGDDGVTAPGDTSIDSVT